MASRTSGQPQQACRSSWSRGAVDTATIGTLRVLRRRAGTHLSSATTLRALTGRHRVVLLTRATATTRWARSPCRGSGATCTRGTPPSDEPRIATSSGGTGPTRPGRGWSGTARSRTSSGWRRWARSSCPSGDLDARTGGAAGEYALISCSIAWEPWICSGACRPAGVPDDIVHGCGKTAPAGLLTCPGLGRPFGFKERHVRADWTHGRHSRHGIRLAKSLTRADFPVTDDEPTVLSGQDDR
jgi:hypothetical protein